MSRAQVFAGAGAGLLIILAVLGFAYRSNNPGSSDVIAPPANNASSDSTNANTAPNFANEKMFTNIGVSSDQVSNLEKTLEQYLTSASKSPSSISYDSLQKLSVNKNAATPIWTISFAIKLDNADAYKAKMDYFGTAGIRLYLYGMDGTSLLYDSQNVGGSPEL